MEAHGNRGKCAASEVFGCIPHGARACREKDFFTMGSDPIVLWRAYRKQYDHWCLAPLDGVVVRAAYTMPPDMFDYFVKYKKWK